MADGHALTQLLEAHLSSNMPVDDHYYMHLVNIQIDVWERTGKDIIIPKRSVCSADLPSKYKLKAIILNTLGMKALCNVIKFAHYFKKPSRIA